MQLKATAGYVYILYIIYTIYIYIYTERETGRDYMCIYTDTCEKDTFDLSKVQYRSPIIMPLAICHLFCIPGLMDEWMGADRRLSVAPTSLIVCGVDGNDQQQRRVLS